MLAHCRPMFLSSCYSYDAKQTQYVLIYTVPETKYFGPNMFQNSECNSNTVYCMIPPKAWAAPVAKHVNIPTVKTWVITVSRKSKCISSVQARFFSQ